MTLKRKIPCIDDLRSRFYTSLVVASSYFEYVIDVMNTVHARWWIMFYGRMYASCDGCERYCAAWVAMLLGGLFDDIVTAAPSDLQIDHDTNDPNVEQESVIRVKFVRKDFRWGYYNKYCIIMMMIFHSQRTTFPSIIYHNMSIRCFLLLMGADLNLCNTYL